MSSQLGVCCRSRLTLKVIRAETFGVPRSQLVRRPQVPTVITSITPQGEFRLGALRYTLLHPGAGLTRAEREMLLE